jgi:hypothetical protein
LTQALYTIRFACGATPETGRNEFTPGRRLCTVLPAAVAAVCEPWPSMSVPFFAPSLVKS